MNCMNNDLNKKIGLFKFQLGHRKFYLNSPKGYNRNIINAHTGLQAGDDDSGRCTSSDPNLSDTEQPGNQGV